MNDEGWAIKLILTGVLEFLYISCTFSSFDTVTGGAGTAVTEATGAAIDAAADVDVASGGAAGLGDAMALR